MEIKTLHLEENIKVSDTLSKDIAKTLRSFADWHATPEIRITRCDHKELKSALLSTCAA